MSKKQFMTRIKERTNDELLLIAHNVTCEYSPQEVRRANVSYTTVV